MTTTQEFFAKAEQKLIGTGRSLAWVEEKLQCTLPRQMMPHEATVARIAYYANVSASTLRPQRFNPDQDSENARNFAELADDQVLTEAEGQAIYDQVTQANFRGIIPRDTWLKKMNALPRKKLLL